MQENILKNGCLEKHILLRWLTFPGSIYLSILKKKVTAGAAAATVAKSWDVDKQQQQQQKTNSFRNTKFGIQIAFSIKMCKMSSSKIKDQRGPP